MSLKAKAAGGVKWTAISAIVAAGSQLLLIAVLARVLSRSDFGLMAIATFVIGFSQIFVDMGISNAIIYKAEVSHKQLSSLYWLNVMMGAGVFLLIFISSPMIARFYDEPRLAGIINMVGISFLIQPFGAQYDVLFRKELNFKSLAIRDIISKMVTLISGCILGYMGYGVYALVFSSILGVLTGTVLLLVVGLPVHRPGFHFRYADVKPLLSFGLFQMGEKVMNYFNSQIDSVIIGKFLGVDTLGVYNIAKNLVMKPPQIINPIITKVSFPVMAKVQTDINKLKHIYLKSLGLMSAINFPIFLFMFFFAESIVFVMFGDRWSEAIFVLRLLSLYSLIRSTGNPLGALQLAKGRADLGFYWNFMLLLVVPLTIYIGSFWGMSGVCYALLISQLVLLFPCWRLMIWRLCNAGMKEYFAVFWRPLVISLIPALFSYLLCFSLNIPMGNAAKLILGGGAFSLLLIGISYNFNKEFVNELNFMIYKK